MSFDVPARPGFEVQHQGDPGEVLLCGFSEYGLAGLTAADYLADQLSMEVIGRLTTEELPAITPFENGRPRHHTRLLSRSDLDLTVLIGELFVPAVLAKPFADSIVDWAEERVSEICVVSGVPVAHGPEDHRPYYVATDDFVEHRLAGRDLDLPGMGGGFLDGTKASLMERGLTSDLRVGVVTTPTHPQTPDAEAALRLLDATTRVYDLDVDLGPLEAFASEVERYYAELAERMEETAEEPTRTPEDRMYM